ncbi:hypothetical protein NDU88_003142 [Pleurodeles waltl]|uniref:Uncharacterized protein n=1 Tax=Pleurodeles waltl TaxID=8319 RepID=A0AAV7T3Y3_PLEWA|nr:hypothetical protein NDU88_003142 [Pleurodeles waltl]
MLNVWICFGRAAGWPCGDHRREGARHERHNRWLHAVVVNYEETCKAFIKGKAISYKAQITELRKEKTMPLQKELDQATRIHQMTPNPVSEARMKEARGKLRQYHLSQEQVNQNMYFQQHYEENKHVGRFLA